MDMRALRPSDGDEEHVLPATATTSEATSDPAAARCGGSASPPTRRRAVHLTRLGFLAASTVVVGVYVVLLDALPADVVWILGAVAMLVLGAVAIERLSRHRDLWAMLGAAHAFWASDVHRLLAGGLWPEAPLVSDLIRLAGYPLLVGGLLLIVRSTRSMRDRGADVDAVIVAGALGVFAWQFAIGPSLADRTADAVATTVGVVLPVAAIVVAFVAVQLVVRSRLGRGPVELLVAATAATLVADVVVSQLVRLDTYAPGHPIDLARWSGFALFVAAALSRDAAAVADAPRRRSLPRLTTGRLLALAAVVLALPTAAAVQTLLLGRDVDGALLIGGMVLIMLVVARLSLVTHELRLSHERIAFDEARDALTGLWSRTRFADRLEVALRQPPEPGSYDAVLLVDLDDFKAVNGGLGHAAGDALLFELAMRLQAIVRPNDVVARMGGDEFAILIQGEPLHTAITVAQRVISTFHEPVTLGDGVIVYTNASIGIVYVEKGAGVDSVLRDADIAMYLAKARGKGRWEVFEPTMRIQAAERLELRTELSTALQRQQLVVHYQPIVDVDTGTLQGLEALLRWDHPTRDRIDPGRFIGIAEETEMIIPIGRWVIEEACRQVQLWDPTDHGLEISVNLSPIQLRDPELVSAVRTALMSTGLTPRRLLLETLMAVEFGMTVSHRSSPATAGRTAPASPPVTIAS